MSLTTDQVQLIKASIPALQEHGNTITKVFYKELLKDHEDLNNIFNQANQANSHQAIALAGALAAYATNIDDLGKLTPEVEKICAKHASLYIKPEHYDVVGEYLLRAMGEVLGAALTKELYDAWAAAYWQLANIMIAREKQMLADSHGWTTWREFRIAEKVKESSEITSFRLEPVNEQAHDDKSALLPPYKPGRYISVMTDVPNLHYLQSRQYSLSDSPQNAARHGYRISVKREAGIGTGPEAKLHPGYLSNILHKEKQIGDVLLLSHPQGVFYFDPDVKSDAPIILISAGVGLTPMISILNTVLLEQQSKRRVSWIHAARSSESMAFGSYVRTLAEENENLSRVVFLKNPASWDAQGQEYTHAGRMNLDVLGRESELCLDDLGAEYYICGPEKFMFDMAGWLTRNGVEEKRVKLELFGTGTMSSL